MTLITTIVPHIPPRKAMLKETLASIKAQTHTDRETIVITDTEHHGSWWSVAQGVAQSTGEWITLCADDDYLLPIHHERCLIEAEDRCVDVLYPWYYPKGEAWSGLRPDHDPHAWLFGLPFDEARVRASSTIPGGGSLIRGDMLRSIGIPKPGDPEWPPDNPYDDWAMYLRLLNRGAVFYHLPERLWIWRFHAGNTSGKGDRWT